jgi:hypothetical protein
MHRLVYLKSSKRRYYFDGGVVSLAKVALAGGVVSLDTLNDGGVVSFFILAEIEPIEAGLTLCSFWQE